MLAIYTDQVFSIGLVNAALQPVIKSARLRNVPESGLYGFEPTCYFGVYMPDTFWLAGDS
jgi:peptide/nickel transport system substrate-binding protein